MAGQAGCLQGQDRSAVTHSSSSHARRSLFRLSCDNSRTRYTLPLARQLVRADRLTLCGTVRYSAVQCGAVTAVDTTPPHRRVLIIEQSPVIWAVSIFTTTTRKHENAIHLHIKAHRRLLFLPLSHSQNTLLEITPPRTINKSSFRYYQLLFGSMPFAGDFKTLNNE
ncbi:hypothetical protein J6590_046578 [Homalodisca vitripennis]|nr:hypothetical protein J6590_046578 [Homalodisca vitripennis]